MAGDFQGAFLVKVPVNVGRAEILDLQYALIYHRYRQLGVGGGFDFDLLLFLGARLRRDANRHGQSAVGRFHGDGRETVRHRQRQVGGIERTDERGRDIDVGQMLLFERQREFGGFFLGRQHVVFQQVVTLDGHQKAAVKGSLK